MHQSQQPPGWMEDEKKSAPVPQYKYAHLKQYIDYNFHERYSAERDCLHEHIIDRHFHHKSPVDAPTLLFTAGCYGAGKGHVMKLLQSKGKISLANYVYVDQDRIRTSIPEYSGYLSDNPYTAGFKTNAETGYLAELIQLHALQLGYNCLVDGSMRDHEWYSQYINRIKVQFPNVRLVILFVSASLVNVLKRNLIRGEKTKRCIPLRCIEESFEKSPISFNILRLLVHSSFWIHNDDKYPDVDHIDQI
jgi:hypothetical protein